MLVPHLIRHAGAEPVEELPDGIHFGRPVLAVNRKQLVHRPVGHAQTCHVDVFGVGHVANGGLHGLDIPAAAREDPFHDAQVFAEAGPEKLAVVVGAEPVHMEDLGLVLDPQTHVQPVPEVVRHVVAAEGQHGHGVAPDFAQGAELRRRALAGHAGAHVHTVVPVQRLVNQGRQGRPASTEDDGIDGHAVVLLVTEGVGRAVGEGSGETAVGVGGQDRVAVLVSEARFPRSSLPIQGLGRGRIVVAFPPHCTVGLERDVGVDGVAVDGGHRDKVAARVGARHYAEKAHLGVDRP